MMFEVGQKVVCVSINGMNPGPGGERMPELNSIYQVREIVVSSKWKAIRLVEIINPILPYQMGLMEALFDVRNFRPLVSKSMQIFHSIVAGVNNGKPLIKEREDA